MFFPLAISFILVNLLFFVLSVLISGNQEDLISFEVRPRTFTEHVRAVLPWQPQLILTGVRHQSVGADPEARIWAEVTSS